MSFPTGFEPDRSGTGHARCGRDRSSTTWSYVFDMRRTSSTSSLTQCDLASQHTAQASPYGQCRCAEVPFLLVAPFVSRRWQVECTRRIQVSSGESGSALTARLCLVIAFRIPVSHCSPSRMGSWAHDRRTAECPRTTGTGHPGPVTDARWNGPAGVGPCVAGRPSIGPGPGRPGTPCLTPTGAVRSSSRKPWVGRRRWRGHRTPTGRSWRG